MIEVALRKTLGTFQLDLERSSKAHTLGLFGPSGSGKSTLLNCIAGILRIDSGRIIVSERTLADTSIGLHLNSARRGIGYVFQDGLLFPHLSVLGNLKYGLEAHGKGPALEEVVSVLELDDLLNRNATKLSGGQARRVAIGRALLSGPRLLLLDEPLSGLDRTLAMKTLHYLQRVSQTFHIPMLYVSHTPSDIFFLCDEAWIIAEGRIVAAGPSRDFLTHVERFHQLDDKDFCTIVAARRESTSQGNAAAYRIGDLTLHCTPDNVRPNQEALLSIHADDVIVAREKPQGISARNVIPAQVTSLGMSDDRAIITLHVDPKCADWVVRLTPAAIRELQIVPGSDLYAILKATSIQAVPIGKLG